MKKIILTIILALGLIGCGTSKPSDNSVSSNTIDPNFQGEYVIFDNDFGFSDPDNDGALTYALALQDAGLIKLLALSRVGFDHQNNGTIIAAAQLQYWGVPGTPIGVNPSTAQRQVTTIGSSGYPVQNPIYEGKNEIGEPYIDIRKFPFDGCLTNDAGCGSRVDMIELYRAALTNAPRKVSIASGGQVTNIAEALRAYPELFAEKVKMVTFLGRSHYDTLTGQDFGGNEYAIWAMQYLIDNLPDSVQLIDCMTDLAFEMNYQHIPNSRIGTLFQQHHINSPVAFVYGLEHPYGVGLLNGYSIIDGIPLLYAAFGNMLPGGAVIGDLVGASFINTSKSADVIRTPNGKHFIFNANTAQWGMMKEYLEEVIIQGDR